MKKYATIFLVLFALSGTSFTVSAADDPCNDPTLTELESISVDDMSEIQYENFTALKKVCADYKVSTSTEKETAAAVWKGTAILYGIGLFFSAIILL